MATTRPPGGSAGGPQARIGIDLSLMREAVNVARESGRAAAREISNIFRTVQNEQRVALEQARQTTAALRAQQSQITATTRADSQVRIQQARAESVAQQQASRVAATVAIEEEKRKTAAHNAEIRERQRAARQSQTLGQNVSQFAGAALGGIGGPAGAVLGGLAGGSPAIAAGLAVSAGAQAAVEATQLAAAYDRQRVAAVNLAGSQSQLNQLLSIYDRATGGAINNAQALADVTRLMSVGFADNAQELDQFARAIRGISIAMGTSQDTVTQNLVLELFSQRGQRLDQLGLQYDKVRQRADELRAADASLTQQQAYQNAVLEQANERFGALADSAAGAATGAERVATEWADLRLEMGQDLRVNVDQAGDALADLLRWINQVRDARRDLSNELNDLGTERAREIAIGRGQQPRQTLTTGERAWIEDAGQRTAARRGRGGVAPGLEDDQVAALRRREEGFAEIEREFRLARQEENTSYERQRASIVSNYNKQITRESEDFARQRANAERKLQMSILDVAQDSARQRVKWEQDTERVIAEARADNAERIAELRADSAEKVAEIEEDFAKDQEKRARDHGNRLRDAAANLDAVAVREEQRRYREENQEAKDAHEERIADAEKSLQKAIDDQNKALAKQEQQQRESLQRRIQEQAENDRLRIEEMKAAFEEQKAQEDIERGIRLERQAEDHAAQLIELARQHADRIQQIKDHAQEERDQFTEESNKFLEDVLIHNQAWLDEQKAINDGVIQRHQELLEAERRALLFRSQGIGPADRQMIGASPNLPPSSVPPVAGLPFTPLAPWTPPKSTTIQGGLNVTIQGTGLQPNEEGRNWVFSVFADLLEEYF